MRITLRQLTLGIFIGWFFFTGSFLYTFVLPQPQHHTSAAMIVNDPPKTALQTIWNAIGKALGVVQSKLQGITAYATSFLAGHTLLKDALEVAWNVARRKLLDMLVNDIISWVQGGGKPRFVTDFPGELTDVANTAVGSFAGALNTMNLCSDFRITINGLFPPRSSSFGERIACTASDIYGNFDRMWERDFARGGWQNWIALQQPQNNVFGAYLIAQGELADQIAQKVDAKKLQIGSGSGFIGSEECAEWGVKGPDGKPTGDTFKKDPQTGKVFTVDARGGATRRCTEKTLAQEEYAGEGDERGASSQKTKQIVCYDAVVDSATGKDQVDSTGKPVTVPGSESYYNEGLEMQCQSKQTLTPGTLVARSAADALNVDIPWLISSKEVTAYLGAIVNAVINRVAREGLTTLQHGSGSYLGSSPSWGTTSTAFDCSRITDLALRQQYCGFGSPTNPYIKTAAQDPIQIIKADLPLLPGLKIDLQNFYNELGVYRDKLVQIRDVQIAVRDTEQRIANTAAAIASAPADILSPVDGRDPSTFVLPAPAQDAACTTAGFTSVTRPAPALQSASAIAETLFLDLRGVSPTLAPSSLDQIGTIASIGQLIVSKTTRYEETTLACTEHSWSSSFAVISSTLEIASALIDTEHKIAAIDEQRRIVQELTAGVSDYREILEKWNVDLGIQGGLITTDQDLINQALAEITPIREDVIGTGTGNDSGLQDLMATTELEFSNLVTAFISYRTNVLTESVGIEAKAGSARAPEGGGYYGELAELQLIESAIGSASVSCVNPLTKRVSCTGL